MVLCCSDLLWWLIKVILSMWLANQMKQLSSKLNLYFWMRYLNISVYITSPLWLKFPLQFLEVLANLRKNKLYHSIPEQILIQKHVLLVKKTYFEYWPFLTSPWPHPDPRPKIYLKCQNKLKDRLLRPKQLIKHVSHDPYRGFENVDLSWPDLDLDLCLVWDQYLHGNLY